LRVTIKEELSRDPANPNKPFEMKGHPFKETTPPSWWFANMPFDHKTIDLMHVAQLREMGAKLMKMRIAYLVSIVCPIV
jgi:hypothetical protein